MINQACVLDWEMPRRKQDKPQHLEEDSELEQVMNSEQNTSTIETTAAQKKPVSKQNSTASTENSDKDMDTRHMGM